jgi:hypothetical protein
VLIGNGGSVTLDSANQGPFSDNSLYELRVGTSSGAANFTSISGPDLRGDGTLTVDNVDLLLFDDANVDDQGSTSDGRLIIGGASGRTGTVNWNSTGQLRTQGHLRVGQGGSGFFYQNGGSVQAGYVNTDGGVRVGSGGGTGVYNLNDGAMEVGREDDGNGIPVQTALQIGADGGSTGTFNVGDGVGSAGSATVDAWGTTQIGLNGGSGAVNILSDGVFRVQYPVSGGSNVQLRLGQSGGASDGTITQTGGILEVQGLLELGFNTGTGIYELNGSTGTSQVRAISANDASTFTFNLDGSGATQISVLGNTGPGDPLSGNSIALGNTTLNVNNLSSTLLTSIMLFEQLDATASLSGSFGNYVQGAIVGQNAAFQDMYLNYFGGDGNDIMLQNTLPSSSLDGLVWNVGAANMDAGWAEGDGNFGVAASGVNPFGTTQNLYLGKGGHATYDGTTNDPTSEVKNLYIGTNRGAGVISGTAGNGTLTVNGSENLTVVSTSDTTQGNAFIGEKGFTGTVNWNSTGVLDVQGQLRVGIDGGTGVVNQTDGIVQAGMSAGTGKYASVGEGANSTGTYNLKNGQLLPDGPGAGSPTRQFRVGIDGGTGHFNVGDGIGAADSAKFQSEDDLYVGQGSGGIGTMTIAVDGLVETTTAGAETRVGAGGGDGTVVQNGGSFLASGAVRIGYDVGSVGMYELNSGLLDISTDDAPFIIGDSGGNGTFVQNNGDVIVDRFVSIGEGNGSVGEYVLNDGTLTTAADGDDATRVAGGGGTGTFRVKGGSFTTTQNLVIAQASNSGSVGLLEFTGSTATFDVGRLETHTGNDSTIGWIADANGVTNIRVINGSGNNRVQLQSTTDAGNNTGTNGLGDLTGNGTKLVLDLSALTTSQDLTLIDNRSGQSIVGFFGDGTVGTGNLYEEGEQILGTGFLGTVTISYIGSAPTGTAGNDVVLSLVSSVIDDADFDQDGDVDGADFLTWQRNVATPSPTLAQGNANGDSVVDGVDLGIWENQFGTSVVASTNVPEPGSVVLLLAAVGLIGAARVRRSMHGA